MVFPCFKFLFILSTSIYFQRSIHSVNSPPAMPAPSLITISAIYPKQLKAEMGKDKPLCSPWALRETIFASFAPFCSPRSIHVSDSEAYLTGAAINPALWSQWPLRETIFCYSKSSQSPYPNHHPSSPFPKANTTPSQINPPPLLLRHYNELLI